MKKLNMKFLALLGFIAPSVALAEAYTVPTSVTSTITQMENAATAYADVLLPYIAAVGLTFIGIAVVYLLFKVFKRFVGGR